MVVFDSQQPLGLQPTRLLRPWDFPGKSTGVGAVTSADGKQVDALLVLPTLEIDPEPVVVFGADLEHLTESW